VSRRGAPELILRFLVQGLRDHTSLYPREDKSRCDNWAKLTSVRIFLSIICSGTPAAVNQLVVTQLYNPEGTAHTLAMNLALQCEVSGLVEADVQTR
jgi:hypothetical protein